MNLSTFSRLATAYYLSGVSIYLRSAPGRGKTSTIWDTVPRIAKELNKNLGLMTITGPNLSLGDTMGYGIPHDSEYKGKIIKEMIFTQPFFFKTDEGKYLWEYDGGVIFVDEADKMDVDIKKIMGEMSLSGRCGPHVLPPGWVVWFAGNRSQDRSGSTKELDFLINRRLEIDVTDDVQGWEVWAHKHGVHPSVITFAISNPSIVFPESLPAQQGPFCTPRSLVRTAEVLGYLAGNKPGADLPVDADAVETAAAAIGLAAAGQLFATLRLAKELPDIDAIIAAPMACRVPEKPDAQMLVAYKLSSLTNKDNIAPVAKYIDRLPKEFAAVYAKSVVTRDPGLAGSKTIMDWCKANASLLTTINSLKALK